MCCGWGDLQGKPPPRFLLREHCFSVVRGLQARFDEIVELSVHWISVLQVITQLVCAFLALGIQHAMRMSHNIICGLPRSTTFPLIISQTAWFPKKKVIERRMSGSNFSATFVEIFFILRRNERAMIENVYWSSCEVPLFLSDFNETWIFSIDFRKILTYQIPWISVQW
jgi:hypothetical protein